MTTETGTEWPYDADRDDPLTALRIPVTCFKPGWMYLVSFDRESGERPTDAEARMLVSFIDYERSKFFEHYQRKLLERPLDIDGGHNSSSSSTTRSVTCRICRPAPPCTTRSRTLARSSVARLRRPPRSGAVSDTGLPMSCLSTRTDRSWRRC